MPKSRFTEEQKRIAVLLFQSPKTAEELSNKLNAKQEELGKELKEMLKLKLIAQEGYPPKYKLKQEIYKEVMRRKEIEAEDRFKLRLKIMIEAQAIEQEILKKQMKEIEAALRKEKDFTVYDVKHAKAIKSREYYSTYAEVNLSVRDFKSLVKLMYFYGPVSVEVIKPSRYEIAISDLQDGLMDMADMIQSYNQYVLKLMNRKELNEFYNKLYEYKK